MEFPLLRSSSDCWIEYRVGSTTLALTVHGAPFDHETPADGALSVQLAFRVPPQVLADCQRRLKLKASS
jgi:lactoylglutathione lyase